MVRRSYCRCCELACTGIDPGDRALIEEMNPHGVPYDSYIQDVASYRYGSDLVALWVHTEKIASTYSPNRTCTDSKMDRAAKGT